MIVFETLFRDNEKIVYDSKELVLIDRFILKNNSSNLELTFEEMNSQWRQGIILKTKGYFDIAEQKIENRMILWQDTAPPKVNFNVSSEIKEIIIYNVWDTGNGVTEYWHNGAAMYIEEIQNGKKYFCNDGYPDDDLNDLIFKLVVNE